MDITSLFEGKAKQLFWQAIDSAHVDSSRPQTEIEPGQAYFSLRLCEMYLATVRKLWRQMYPIVHCYVSNGGAETHTLASPAQFLQLGDANLDRIANLNIQLGGPTPYNGEAVTLMAGLYSIPGHDSAKALIEVVGTLAAFDPGVAGQGVALSKIVKSGVESILGLDQATLHLGIRDGFAPGSHPLKSGYFAGIGAAESVVDPAQLWVVHGRLMQGKTAATAVAYAAHDYMLIAIDRVDAREDWAQLREIQDARGKISNLVDDLQFSVTEKRSRLAALWPVFMQVLADSPHLTIPDRERIAGLISGELLKKLKLQQEGNPFLKAA